LPFSTPAPQIERESGEVDRRRWKIEEKYGHRPKQKWGSEGQLRWFFRNDSMRNGPNSAQTQKAKELETLILSNPAEIVLSIPKNGRAQVKDLLINGRPWDEQ
jgi:hypothetical protein